MKSKAKPKTAKKKIRIKAFAAINLRATGKVLQRNDEVDMDEEQARKLIDAGWAREVIPLADAKESDDDTSNGTT
jgi:hypothetical protein